MKLSNLDGLANVYKGVPSTQLRENRGSTAAIQPMIDILCDDASAEQ